MRKTRLLLDGTCWKLDRFTPYLPRLQISWRNPRFVARQRVCKPEREVRAAKHGPASRGSAELQLHGWDEVNCSFLQGNEWQTQRRVGQWRLRLEGMSLINPPMGSSFAFSVSQGTSATTHWENKYWCQSFRWVPSLLFWRQVLECSCFPLRGGSGPTPRVWGGGV